MRIVESFAARVRQNQTNISGEEHGLLWAPMGSYGLLDARSYGARNATL